MPNENANGIYCILLKPSQIMEIIDNTIIERIFGLLTVNNAIVKTEKKQAATTENSQYNVLTYSRIATSLKTNKKANDIASLLYLSGVITSSVPSPNSKNKIFQKKFP